MKGLLTLRPLVMEFGMMNGRINIKCGTWLELVCCISINRVFILVMQNPTMENIGIK